MELRFYKNLDVLLKKKNSNSTYLIKIEYNELTSELKQLKI